MKKLLTLTALIAVFSFTSCNKDDEKETTDERFTKAMYTAENYETIKDNDTGLEWVNDKRGCFGGIVTPGTQCDDTEFADLSDWRTPTPDELAMLMKEISSRDMKLNYIVSTCVLMSTSEEVWVFTENSDSPGERTTNKPGNAGLRCVRSFK
ncbi:MAG: hypothetical protein KAG37_00725 [Flavobacteriales bacterium]|nr:hypothetical protein [Flavobacteriales bacterium]